MRPWIILGSVVVVLMAGLVAYVALDSPDIPDVPAVQPAAEAPPPPYSGLQKSKPRPPPPPPAPAAESNEPQDKSPVSDDTVQTFGQEFERLWRKDRERLGVERHKEMEKLWFEGRRPRGDTRARMNLERLVQEFPDTNRAGCAALELGHQWMRNRNLGLEERRAKAAESWRLVTGRYTDVLCEYNAPAAGLAKLGLASQVLRYSSPGEARAVLEDIIKNRGHETDHLGQPLSKTAQALLDGLK